MTDFVTLICTQKGEGFALDEDYAAIPCNGGYEVLAERDDGRVYVYHFKKDEVTSNRADFREAELEDFVGLHRAFYIEKKLTEKLWQTQCLTRTAALLREAKQLSGEIKSEMDNLNLDFSVLVESDF